MKWRLFIIIRMMSLITSIVMSLSACSTSSGNGSPATYEAEPETTIEGSKLADPSVLRPDILFLPSTIDGQSCGNAWYNDASSRWHKQFSISPGKHRLVVVVSIGGSFSGTGEGGVTIDAIFQSGKRYYIRGTPPATRGTSPQSTVWIEDDQGNPVSDRRVAIIQLYSGSDMIAVPMGAGKTPLFVP